ncbi:MAG: hypothetical protein WAU70_06605 [Flavobacteriales bacterium]
MNNANPWRMICQPNGMALRYSFEPGAQQSLKACEYFNMLGNDLVETYASEVEARRYWLGQVGYAQQPVRVWSKKDTGSDRVLELLPWMRSLLGAMTALADPHFNEDVLEVMRRWMDIHLGEDTMFIELPHRHQAFTDEEVLALTIGITGGETVLLSAPNVMFIKLEKDLFGLSVANAGSYLVERLLAKEVEPAYMRRPF